LAKTAVALINKPAWVELSTPDAAASRDFYARVFGWDVEVIEDPQYGGYGMARIGDQDAAGIAPKQSAEQPTAWAVYFGTDDVDRLADKVKAAGGSVITDPFDVGDQGRMAVFQDPSGAFFSGWQAAQMRSFATDQPNSYGWVELNARGLERAIPFYEEVFGWTHTTSEAEGDTPAYTQFQLNDEQIAGAFEMNPEIPSSVPSYWTVYFNVDDVDRTFQQALQVGAKEVVSPQDYPGGRFAILSDPHGATFALVKSAQP
jgi:hypothetical protein